MFQQLFIQFCMRAKRDEMRGAPIDFFIYGAKIASDIDAATSFVRTLEGMIFEKWVKGVFIK